MSPNRVHTYLILLLVSAIWGVAGVVIKYTLFGFAPLIFLTYRFFLSTLVCLPMILVLRNQIPKDKKLLLEVLLYGFLTSSVALGLLFFGTEKTSAIDATLITATAPILIAVAGALFLNEHVTLREKIGIGIAFAGTTIAITEPLIHDGASFAGLSGNLLVLLSVIVSTITAVYAKILMRKDVDPLFATNISFVVGFLTIFPVTLFFYTPKEIIASVLSTQPSYHLGVLYMTFLSGILAYYLWHKAEKSIEVGEVGLIAYLYPVFGTPLAILWLKEKVSLPFILGAIVIAIGVAVAEIKTRKSLKSKKKTYGNYSNNFVLTGGSQKGYLNYWAKVRK